MTGSIRIIGGKWRGRKLPVLDSDGLRPTADRIKETLFNWLMPVIQDATCLDCFSGSGSLGFEAYSRGASAVTLLEKTRHIATQLQKNSQLLAATGCTVVATDSLIWLKQPAIQQYDIVFIDPPFNQQLVGMTIDVLESQGWLKPNSYIYVETELNCNLATLPSSWQLHRQKTTDQVHSRLYIREIN